MNPSVGKPSSARDGARSTIGWLLSLALYSAFAFAVFMVQGNHPLLGPDHVTYMELADSIAESRPAGDYWRETNSVRFFGVVLAYLADTEAVLAAVDRLTAPIRA